MSRELEVKKFEELSASQQMLYNNIGTEICGYPMKDVMEVFDSIERVMLVESENNFM